MEVNKIYCMDSREGLKLLENNSIDCCVTSPPYWGLRDYDVDGQIGLEETPEEYVEKIVQVFREVRRVLRDDGTLWLNLGDSYSKSVSNNGGYSGKSTLSGFTNLNTKGRQSNDFGARRKLNAGIKPKDLVGIPWMVAFALRTDGWYLRSDIIWHKPNCMPESVTDRPTKAHEYIFLLSKSSSYYYNRMAILEPVTASTVSRMSQDIENQVGSTRANGGQKSNGPIKACVTKVKGNRKTFRGGGAYTQGKSFYNSFKVENECQGNEPNETMLRNKRTVWSISTAQCKYAHFATFPEKLIKPCILAGCPEGGTVLDPFMGAGTTAVVAWKHNRNYLGYELNPEYIEIAEQRLAGTVQQVSMI